MVCDCDLRQRRWNPNTGRCETCDRTYANKGPQLTPQIGRPALEAGVKCVAEEISPLVASMFGSKVGFALFLFDFGKEGGLAYAANAQRADMIGTIKEWLSIVDDSTPAVTAATITDEQILELRDSQSPITGNIGYACAVALDDKETVHRWKAARAELAAVWNRRHGGKP